MPPHQLNELLGETLLAILAVTLTAIVTIRSPRLVRAIDAGTFTPTITILLSALPVWLLLKEDATANWAYEAQWSSTPLHGYAALTYTAAAVVAAFRPLVAIAGLGLCATLIATALRRLSLPHSPGWPTTSQVLRRRWIIAPPRTTLSPTAAGRSTRGRPALRHDHLGTPGNPDVSHHMVHPHPNPQRHHRHQSSPARKRFTDPRNEPQPQRTPGRRYDHPH